MTKRLHFLLLVLLLAAACHGPRTIPRSDMKDILYQMLVLDQQIKKNRTLQRQADTLQVYAGIFKEFGYTTEDFHHSVTVYLQDPTKMEKIMGDVAARLEKDRKQAQKEVDLRNWRQRLMRLYDMPPDTTLPRQGFRPVDTLRIRFTKDSVWLYKPVDPLSLIPRDSIRYLRDSRWWEVWADSTAAREHRRIRDSLGLLDTLVKPEIPVKEEEPMVVSEEFKRKLREHAKKMEIKRVDEIDKKPALGASGQEKNRRIVVQPQKPNKGKKKK